MARVVGIHGIGQQESGSYELGAIWYNALRSGLAVADESALAESLTAADVRVAFFGDLFLPPEALSAALPGYKADNLNPGLERDLVVEFYAAALEQDPTLQPPPEALGLPGSVPLQTMVKRLLKSPTFAGLAEHLFVGALKQVTSFLVNREIKQEVLNRVKKLIDDDTRVLIGHSLGSVVAYEYLCREQPPSVKMLVTLGSPLGIPNLIFDRLTPPPDHGRGRWPSAAADWANVADPHDAVALQKQLAELFPRPQAGQRHVLDLVVDNGDQPHAINRYLNKRQTGRVIAGGLK